MPTRNKQETVVYSSIFTSNHNHYKSPDCQNRVVYSSIFTSNHNKFNEYTTKSRLYILLSLHQTTTDMFVTLQGTCCIFFYLYIKPQLKPKLFSLEEVVYSSIFTSNHNCNKVLLITLTVVYSSIFTSNHN